MHCLSEFRIHHSYVFVVYWNLKPNTLTPSKRPRLNFRVWKTLEKHIILLSIHVTRLENIISNWGMSSVQSFSQLSSRNFLFTFLLNHLLVGTVVASMTASNTINRNHDWVCLCLFQGERKRHFKDKDIITLLLDVLSGVHTWGVSALSPGLSFSPLHKDTHALAVGVSTLKLKIKFQVHFLTRSFFCLFFLTHERHMHRKWICNLQVKSASCCFSCKSPLTPRHCDEHLSLFSNVLWSS